MGHSTAAHRSEISEEMLGFKEEMKELITKGVEEMKELITKGVEEAIEKAMEAVRQSLKDWVMESQATAKKKMGKNYAGPSQLATENDKGGREIDVGGEGTQAMEMSKLLPEMPALQVFDESSERIFVQKAPASISQGTNPIICSPNVYWNDLETHCNMVMIYKLHENEYGKCASKFDNQPEEINNLEKKRMQLEIELHALEKDEVSKARVGEIKTELDDLRDKLQPLMMKYKKEKHRIGESRQLKQKREELHFATQEAGRRSDLARVADLRYGAIQEVESALVRLEGDTDEKVMLTETVGPEQIAKVVSRWNGIPVTRLGQNEKERLIGLGDSHISFPELDFLRYSLSPLLNSPAATSPQISTYKRSVSMSITRLFSIFYLLLASTSHGSPGIRKSAKSSVFSLFNLKDKSKFWTESNVRSDFDDLESSVPKNVGALNYTKACNIANYLKLLEVEFMYLPVPVNFIFIGFEGKGNQEFKPHADELERWFTKIDHIFEHTRIPKIREVLAPFYKISIDKEQLHHLSLVSHINYNFSVHAIQMGEKVTSVYECAIDVLGRIDHVFNVSAEGAGLWQVDVDMMDVLITSLVEYLQLENAYNVLILNPKRNGKRAKYGYRSGLSETEITFLKENKSLQTRILQSGNSPWSVLARNKIKRPLYEKHPMAKFSWTITDETDTIEWYNKCRDALNNVQTLYQGKVVSKLHCLGVLLDLQKTNSCNNIKDKESLALNIVSGLQLPSEEIRGEILFVLYNILVLQNTFKDDIGTDAFITCGSKLLRLSLDALMRTESDDIRSNCIALLSVLAQRLYFESAYGTDVSSGNLYEDDNFMETNHLSDRSMMTRLFAKAIKAPLLSSDNQVQTATLHLTHLYLSREDSPGKEVQVLVEENIADYVFEILRLSGCKDTLDNTYLQVLDLLSSAEQVFKPRLAIGFTSLLPVLHYVADVPFHPVQPQTIQLIMYCVSNCPRIMSNSHVEEISLVLALKKHIDGDTGMLPEMFTLACSLLVALRESPSCHEASERMKWRVHLRSSSLVGVLLGNASGQLSGAVNVAAFLDERGIIFDLEDKVVSLGAGYCYGLAQVRSRPNERPKKD